MVFEGWEGYRQSIIHAVAPLTPEQLIWRPAAHLRSVGELARHIALGPIAWFLWMGAPGSDELAARITASVEDVYGKLYVYVAEHSNAVEARQFNEGDKEKGQ